MEQTSVSGGSPAKTIPVRAFILRALVDFERAVSWARIGEVEQVNSGVWHLSAQPNPRELSNTVFTRPFFNAVGVQGTLRVPSRARTDTDLSWSDAGTALQAEGCLVFHAEMDRAHWEGFYRVRAQALFDLLGLRPERENWLPGSGEVWLLADKPVDWPNEDPGWHPTWFHPQKHLVSLLATIVRFHGGPSLEGAAEPPKSRDRFAREPQSKTWTARLELER